MERCPCCNARLLGATLCPRCRTDLSLANEAERAALRYLRQAFRHWGEDAIEPSLTALTRSLRMKHTPLANAFFNFLIDRQCQAILQLLAQQQTLAAKRRLYPLRRLQPDHALLRQLDRFIDYRLVNSR